MADGLDPEDWTELRALGHRMLDDMIDHLAGLRDGPVWQQPPQSPELARPLPRQPQDPAAVYDEFRRLVLPYSVGNLHPGFMGWVHGGGTAIGMLAEMLAGGLNANLGGRDHRADRGGTAGDRLGRRDGGFPAGDIGACW